MLGWDLVLYFWWEGCTFCGAVNKKYSIFNTRVTYSGAKTISQWKTSPKDIGRETGSVLHGGQSMVAASSSVIMGSWSWDERWKFGLAVVLKYFRKWLTFLCPEHQQLLSLGESRLGGGEDGGVVEDYWSDFSGCFVHREVILMLILSDRPL